MKTRSRSMIYKGFRIEPERATQLGYRTHEGKIPGRGRKVASFFIYAPGDERPVKTTSSLASAKAYVDNYLGDSMQTNAARGVADEDAAAELILYIVNTSELYGPNSIGASIETNYAKKWRAGKFDREKAEQGYKYLVDAGAKSYVKEHGTRGDKWNEMFNAPTRRLVAREITQAFVDEAKLGNFRG